MHGQGLIAHTGSVVTDICCLIAVYSKAEYGDLLKTAVHNSTALVCCIAKTALALLHRDTSSQNLPTNRTQG